MVAYVGKLLIHPVPIAHISELWQRASVGPIPGQLVLLAGLLFHGTWVAIAYRTLRSRRGGDRPHAPAPTQDRMLQLASGRG